MEKNKKKLGNYLYERHELFLERHFLRLRYIFYNPWVFLLKKQSLNNVSSYQKDAKVLIRVAANIT